MFHLPEAGIVGIRDFETHETCMLDGGNENTRKWFFDTKTAIHRETATLFSRSKIDLEDIKTSDTVSDILTQYFRLRERRQG